MKKFLSLALTACILAMTIGVIPITAGAADVTVPEPVFEMDLSEYSNGNRVVKNAKNPSTVVNVKGTPVVSTYTYGDGQTFKALNFADDSVTAKNTGFLGAVQIPPTVASSLIKNNIVVDSETRAATGTHEMTVEFWAKDCLNSNLSGSYSRLFCYEPGTENKDTLKQTGDSMWVEEITTSNTAMITKLYTNGTKTTWPGKASGPNWPTTGTGYNGGWRHYVLTRKFVPNTTQDSLDAIKGKWYYNVLDNNGHGSEYSYTDGDAIFALDPSTYHFVIGGEWFETNDFTKLFYGEIAEFRVYNVYMNKDQMSALYVNSKGKFQDSALTKQSEQDLTVRIDNETNKAIADLSSAKVKEFAKASLNPQIIMAVKENEGAAVTLKNVSTGTTMDITNYRDSKYTIEGFVWDALSSLKPLADKASCASSSKN